MTNRPTALARASSPSRARGSTRNRRSRQRPWPRSPTRSWPTGAGSTQDGAERDLTWDDVLIVAPYNAQVGAIKRLLPETARVGTVDKFQGQEAPISIYSMTTSAPELAPRGMDFLYSRNRLNVATSRARCVAVVVASPALLQARARTPAQMRLANALCRFVELASGEPSADGTADAEPDQGAPLTLGLV